MESIQTRQAAASVSRREVIRRMAVLGTGLSVGLAAGCTPLKIGLHAHPGSFDTDREIGERVLRVFVSTVIPGVDETSPHLTRVFEDDYYPFAEYRGDLIADLCQRSDKLYRMKLFSWLDSDQRTHVIQDALSSHKIIRQLYEGAIFLAQVSCYAGIYDAAGGCDLIDFPGAGFIPFADQTYPAQGRYLASSLTTNGNYA